jgi:hypothetical protein
MYILVSDEHLEGKVLLSVIEDAKRKLENAFTDELIILADSISFATERVKEFNFVCPSLVECCNTIYVEEERRYPHKVVNHKIHKNYSRRHVNKKRVSIVRKY